MDDIIMFIGIWIFAILFSFLILVAVTAIISFFKRDNYFIFPLSITLSILIFALAGKGFYS